MRKYMAGRMPNIKNLHETKETFSDLVLGMCALTAAHAQDNDFDLRQFNVRKCS